MCSFEIVKSGNNRPMSKVLTDKLVIFLDLEMLLALMSALVSMATRF